MPNLITGADYKYFIPIVKKIINKYNNITCKVCKRKLEVDEEYIYFHTTSREIFILLGLRSLAKHPRLAISICSNCWIRDKEKLKQLASTGYIEVELNE